jgi:phosphohistidine swiveling domain-containing protein
MNAELTWDKPGPGGWRYDGAHNDGPKAHFLRELFAAAMADGFRSFTSRYGLPLSHVEIGYVNGYAYDTARIAGVPAGDGPPPPAWILRIATRLHPELRRRARHARTALRDEIWRADLDRWEDELRPARTAANRALQAVDVERLDDIELAAHLDACVANVAGGLREHFGLIGAAAIPVGLHLQRSESPAAAFAQLGGAAGASTGATLGHLRAIADELAAAGTALGDLRTLDDVRIASPRAAALLDGYLDEYGQRIVSTYDITGKRLIEMPELVMRSIMGATTGTAPDAPSPAGDRLLDDARRAFASRDDHAGVSGTWPIGLARRALLEAGGRLAAAGRLERAGDVVDCVPGEVQALLRSDGGPTGATIAARTAERVEAAAATPPERLGVEHPPPAPSVFPPAMRTMTEAMFAALGVLSARSDGGVGIGDRTHRGRAVVAHQAIDAIERLEPGDVLVTSMTTPAFNSVLPIVGGLVTVHGGQFSHAGIVARELDIPTVIGVADALTRIPDGALVDVDPTSATVTVVSDAACGV